MPTMLSDDQSKTKEFVDMIGPNTVAGSAGYIVDRISEFIDEGVDEIMFGRIPNEPSEFQRFEEEVIAAFN